MNVRRRIALWLDPSLAPIPEPFRLDWGGSHTIARQLEKIAGTLDQLNRKTVKRRPRIIVCEHQDTHPEWGAK